MCVCVCPPGIYCCTAAAPAGPHHHVMHGPGGGGLSAWAGAQRWAGPGSPRGPEPPRAVFPPRLAQHGFLAVEAVSRGSSGPRFLTQRRGWAHPAGLSAALRSLREQEPVAPMGRCSQAVPARIPLACWRARWVGWSSSPPVCLASEPCPVRDCHWCPRPHCEGRSWLAPSRARHVPRPQCLGAVGSEHLLQALAVEPASPRLLPAPAETPTASVDRRPGAE